MTHVCSVCGVGAVATCADCGEGFCWSHGDGIPAGTPGRLHATCATLAASQRANEARSLARSLAEATFVDVRPDLAERRRILWMVAGDERDDDPRNRFRHLTEVVVVIGHRDVGSPVAPEVGLGVDADGHFWDVGPAAEAPLSVGWRTSLRSGRWGRRRGRAEDGPRATVTPPQRGLTGTRRRSDDLAPATAGDRELRGLRDLTDGRPGPVLAS